MTAEETSAAPREGQADPAPRHRQTVLFIGGLGRSGSTLIEKLLNELPETFAVGETLHLWERGVRDRERCGCGEPFAECPHWQAVGQMAFGDWDRAPVDRLIDLRWQVDRSRRLPRILARHRRGGRDALNADEAFYVRHLGDVLRAGAAVAARDNGGMAPMVLLESSKHLSTAALLALDPELDVRVLHLLRDPRGVAYSWTKEVARPEAGPDAVMPRYRPWRTALRWVTDNLGFRALARLGVPTLTLRYEDFLAEPTDTLGRIARFAGLEPAGGGFDFLTGNTAELHTAMHSVAGNPLRFGGSTITLRVDDAWRSALDRRSTVAVTLLCLPVLRFFGYRVRG